MDFDIKSCTEDVDIWAPKQINIKADSSGESTWTSAGLVTIESKGHASQATTGHFSLTADKSIAVKSTTSTINIEAAADSSGSINIKAAEDMMLQAADVMNIKSSTHKETAGNIYMNTSAQAAAAAASASPNSPDVAEGAVGAIRAFIPETMVLLSIDIPNPRSTQGTSLTDLALNINTNPGYGGENIRNLHDTMVDMQTRC